MTTDDPITNRRPSLEQNRCKRFSKIAASKRINLELIASMCLNDQAQVSHTELVGYDFTGAVALLQDVDGDLWLTTHVTVEEMLEYLDSDPTECSTVLAVDVDTGTEYEIEVHHSIKESS